MKRTGGVAKEGHRKKPVEDGDVYFDDETAQQMFKYLLPHVPKRVPIIYDECCNNGVLGYNIGDLVGYGSLILHDIKNDLIHGAYYDINRKADIIVCNPPWKESIAKEIFFKLKKDLSEDGVLFFIINNVFMYQGWQRAIKLECQKFYFLPRYVFQPSGRPLLDCGVAVYHNGKMPDKAAQLPCYIHIDRK